MTTIQGSSDEGLNKGFDGGMKGKAITKEKEHTGLGD